MALKKTAGATAGTAKKTVAKASTAKKAAPKKAAGTTATKKAAPKKAAGPKLSEPQHKLLEKLAGITDEAGYHADKKPENKTLETLLKHKLVKRGKKHPTTKNFHYSISKAGEKHLKSSPAPASSSSSPAAPKSS